MIRWILDNDKANSGRRVSRRRPLGLLTSRTKVRFASACSAMGQTLDRSHRGASSLPCPVALFVEGRDGS